MRSGRRLVQSTPEGCTPGARGRMSRVCASSRHCRWGLGLLQLPFGARPILDLIQVHQRTIEALAGGFYTARRMTTSYLRLLAAALVVVTLSSCSNPPPPASEQKNAAGAAKPENDAPIPETPSPYEA